MGYSWINGIDSYSWDIHLFSGYFHGNLWHTNMDSGNMTGNYEILIDILIWIWQFMGIDGTCGNMVQV